MYIILTLHMYLQSIEPVVKYISPNHGSLAGGTMVHVHGHGEWQILQGPGRIWGSRAPGYKM